MTDTFIFQGMTYEVKSQSTKVKDIRSFFENEEFKIDEDSRIYSDNKFPLNSQFEVLEHADGNIIQFYKTGYKFIRFKDCATGTYEYRFNMFALDRVHEYIKRRLVIKLVSIPTPTPTPRKATPPAPPRELGPVRYNTPAHHNSDTHKTSDSACCNTVNTSNGIVTILTQVDIAAGLVTTKTTVTGVSTPTTVVK